MITGGIASGQPCDQAAHAKNISRPLTTSQLQQRKEEREQEGNDDDFG